MSNGYNTTRRRRRIKRLAAACLLLLVAVILTLRYHISYMILYSRGDEGPDKVAQRDSYRDDQITFHRDGQTLNGWFIRRPGSKVMIFYGGKGRSGISYLDHWRRHISLPFVIVDYRGYGTSTGTPRESVLVDDAVHILDQIISRTGLRYEDVILTGESLGSGVAVQVAARRPVGKLILLVPYDSVSAVADGMLSPLPLSWLLPDTFRSDRYAPQVGADVAIYAAGLDREVPVEHARRLHRVFLDSRGAQGQDSVNYYEYPAAGHRNIRSQPGFWDSFNAELLQ